MQDVLRAAFPDDVKVHWVSAEAYEQFRVEAYCEGQSSIMLDQPAGHAADFAPQIAGQSRGWPPLTAFVASIASCAANTYALVADDLKLQTGKLRLVGSLLVDQRAVHTDLTARPRFAQLSLDFYDDKLSDAAKLPVCAAELVRRSPMLCLLASANVTLVLRWFGNEGAAALYTLNQGIGDGDPTPAEVLRLSQS